MRLFKSNKTKGTPRQVFLFAAVIVLFLTACPVKKVIKILGDVPVEAGHLLPGNANVYSAGYQQNCTEADRIDAAIISEVSAPRSNYLPAAVYTVIFLVFSGLPPGSSKLYRSYNRLNVRGPVPIFLQHRKLII